MSSTPNHDLAHGPLRGCQVCGHDKLEPIIDLGHQPPCDSLLTRGQLDEAEKHYPLRLFRCPECSLAQIDYAVPPEVLFYAEYPYRSGITPTLANNLRSTGFKAVERFALTSSDLAIDIGSNDGTLLSSFKEKGIRVLGVEPTNIARIAIGNHVFEALVLGGHSVAQVSLYEPNLKLLLTGDQLLERITPNIGVWPYGETDPLPRYLDSLRTIARLDIAHVLPAHHRVYEAGVQRAHALVAHHGRALRKFMAKLGPQGMTAAELGLAVYGDQHEVLHAYLAMGETLAHLLWLERQGHVRREETPARIRWYPGPKAAELPTLTLS